MSSLPLYERFAQVMEHMVTHDGDGGHGYTWDDRWGDGTYETVTLSDGSTVTIQNGDRDCSSGVISALRAVGVDTHGASYTGDMRDELLKTGLFEWVPMSVPRYAKRGDIYLNEAKHTSVCKSEDPDMLMQFSINENGGKMPDAIGIPEDMLRKAASMAVCKINIDSDLRLAMTASIRQYFNEHPDHFDPRQYLKPARANIKSLVKHKIVDVLGCNGKA